MIRKGSKVQQEQGETPSAHQVLSSMNQDLFLNHPHLHFYRLALQAPSLSIATIVAVSSTRSCLSRSTLEGLAEHEELSLIVDGEHTSASDTTENVGASTLEE